MGRPRNRAAASGNCSFPVADKTAGLKERLHGANVEATSTETRAKKPQAAMFSNVIPILVTLATMICRVLYVIKPRNWWMVHPDEVYQSVEVAHFQLYGYGFRSYEFSPPASQHQNVTRYKEMELNADMYGLRSPLYPYFYVMVGWLASWTGLNHNPYILWRVAHVLVSSILPLAVHRYVSKLYKSYKAGSMAAIMVASSVQLNVIGTHCLVHSFLAPFTFFSLFLFVKYSSYKRCPTASEGNSVTCTDSWKRSGNSAKSNGASKGNGVSPDVNFNHISQNGNLKLPQQSHSNRAYKNATYYIKSLVILWNWQIFCAGLLMGLVSYIRPDVILVHLLHFILFGEFRKILHSARVIPIVCGLFIACGIGLAVDFHYYGIGVISPLNWFHFNVVRDLSAVLFGRSSSSVYWNEMVSIHGLGFLLALSFVIEIALCLHVASWEANSAKKGKQEDHSNGDGANFKTKKYLSSFRPFLVWSTLFIVYLANGHKEIRFLHDVFVLILVYVSIVFVKLKKVVRNETLRVNLLRAVLAIFVMNQWIVFPSPTSNGHWVYQRTEAVQDVNACLRYVASRSDVTGVFCDASLHMTGGMTLLHHDVAVMSLMTGGYYEYGPVSRINLTSRASARDRNISVIEFTRASDYVASQNALATARVIITKKAYNYVVFRRDNQFLPVGFKEVFTAGSRGVLRRSLDEQSERTLETLLERIPLGTNATVLLHEGDVLYHMNQYDRASQRFQHAIHLNASLLEAYLPLEDCFHKLGQQKAAKDLQTKCRSIFNARQCAKARKITRV